MNPNPNPDPNPNPNPSPNPSPNQVDLLIGAAPPALPAPRDKTFMATVFPACDGRTYALNAFFDKVSLLLGLGLGLGLSKG